MRHGSSFVPQLRNYGATGTLKWQSRKLLAIVNVNLWFVDTSEGYGLGQRFAVGGKLPAFGLSRLTFQLERQLHGVIIDFFGGDGGAFGDAGTGGRVILAVELKVRAFFVSWIQERVTVALPFRDLNRCRRGHFHFRGFPVSNEAGATISPFELQLLVRGRSVRPHALAAGAEDLSILGNSPIGNGDDFAIAFSGPFPFVRTGLGDRPGVTILGGMIFPVEWKGFNFHLPTMESSAASTLAVIRARNASDARMRVVFMDIFLFRLR